MQRKRATAWAVQWDFLASASRALVAAWLSVRSDTRTTSRKAADTAPDRERAAQAVEGGPQGDDSCAGDDRGRGEGESQGEAAGQSDGGDEALGAALNSLPISD
ncbi:hypothetical protein [Streptomyces sp. P9(2023)]|uniref:hypothetical protein n=1 Tax=Streptomyces sp. P9(2023) TaxID=3064394 RepID=UPI0028F4509C|nr:hypothetical protein [Streptomyces sp. P9(2023)]